MFLVLALGAVPFTYDGGSLRPGQTLSVRDINGAIRVHAGDRLSIHAMKTGKRSDPNAVAVKVETSAEGILVCVRYPPEADRGCNDRRTTNSDNNDTTVDFDITVPHGVAVDAKTVNGGVDVVTDGRIDVGAVNGGVRADGSDVRSAKTVNGSVVVHVTDRGNGEVSAKSVNGSIEVSLPAGSGVSFSARTLNGSIHADGVDVQRSRYGPGERANVTLGDGARRVSLETLNGSITLRR